MARSRTVLIVEDDVLIRLRIRDLLEKAPDIRVVGVAGNGEEAVRLARVLHPDAILMDLSLPFMDGLEATKRIKAERPETKVILLSYYDQESVRTEAVEAGADAFVSKNRLFMDFASIIHQLIAATP